MRLQIELQAGAGEQGSARGACQIDEHPPGPAERLPMARLRGECQVRYMHNMCPSIARNPHLITMVRRGRFTSAREMAANCPTASTQCARGTT